MPLQKHDQQIVFTDAYRFKKHIKKYQNMSKTLHIVTIYKW